MVASIIEVPLSYFSDFDVSFLVRSHTLWSTMIVIRHSVSPHNDGLAEALYTRRANP